MTDARDVGYEELTVGREASREYVITSEVYGHFLAAFDDRSPIHVDETFARARGFSDRVMHGAILNGFISHFVGMHFPGRHSLLLSVDLRFSQPSFLGDRLRLSMTVSQLLETQQVAVLNFSFSNLTQGRMAANGRLQVKIGDAP